MPRVRCVAFLSAHPEGFKGAGGIVARALKTEEGVLATQNGLEEVMNALDPRLRDVISSHPPLRSQGSWQDFEATQARGRALWEMIYTRHDVYGRLLSETKYLDGIETELCAIGALVPLSTPIQLKSHTLGAKKLGATDAQIQAIFRLGQIICRMRRIP
ncbi:hypothetical protein EV182_003574 [Spiromyces aspiralis]|uniref:Uncharacterized protein n=1 Tax=Spiromyces aspiralis TaxID=68401 RepID=A0ACC1HRM7_9FUNG|nr:hypothetical protein EV182_003574 [Spiromyces aspiralis]